VLRFRVNRTGEHLVRLTAVDSLGRAAHDQAQLSVSGCSLTPAPGRFTAGVSHPRRERVRP
jgi:hypothetical protein